MEEPLQHGSLSLDGRIHMVRNHRIFGTVNWGLPNPCAFSRCEGDFVVNVEEVRHYMHVYQ